MNALFAALALGATETLVLAALDVPLVPGHPWLSWSALSALSWCLL